LEDLDGRAKKKDLEYMRRILRRKVPTIELWFNT
jgi:hypothetical protein